MLKKIKTIPVLILLLIIITNCSQQVSKWTSYFNDEESILDEKIIVQMVKDDNGKLLIVSGSGNISSYNDDTDNWTILFTPEEMSLDRPQTLTIGLDGSLWIGSRKSGLARYQSDNKQWSNFGVSNGLLDEDIRVILQDNTGKLWVGTGKSGIFTSDDNGESWQHIMIEEGFSNFTVHTIFEDSHGHIWVSGTAIYRYDPISNQWSVFTDGSPRFNSLTQEWETPPAETNVVAETFVFSIAEDPNGALWFGAFTTGGVMKYDPALNTWDNLNIWDNFTVKYDTYSVRAVIIDQEGNLWFGTSEGAVQYNPQTDEWVTFNRDNEFTNYSTTSIVIDNVGQVWFSTFGDGIYRYDPDR